MGPISGLSVLLEQYDILHLSPQTYPMKGLAVYIIIGSESCDLVKRSPTVPPATLRQIRSDIPRYHRKSFHLKNALPENPSRNLATSMVAVLRANAHGISLRLLAEDFIWDAHKVDPTRPRRKSKSYSRLVNEHTHHQ